MDVMTYLKSERDMHIAVVRAFFEKQMERYGSLSSEYKEMLSHIEEYSLLGGKWHRPTLALITYRLSGGEAIEAAREVAVSMELLHRFLLNHDDLIDRDLQRHGGPTLEQVYMDEFGERFAGKKSEMFDKGMSMIAGDIVNVYAYEKVLESPVNEAVKLTVIRLLNQNLMETTAGWQLQTLQNFMDIDAVTEEDFLKGLRLVSAQYSFVWPLRLGQLLAGTTWGEWDSALEEYGTEVGTAFQIADDILGMFGDRDKTGKPVGHDFREGKKTLLVLKAFENGSDKQKELLNEKLGSDINEAELSYIQEVMRETNALAYSKKKASEHVARALEALEDVHSEDVKALNYLRELATFMIERER